MLHANAFPSYCVLLHINFVFYVICKCVPMCVCVSLCVWSDICMYAYIYMCVVCIGQ